MCIDASVFRIDSVERSAHLEFANREPASTSEPIEYFTVRVGSDGLEATARVYAYWHPVDLFDYLAAHWNGWEGAKRFESLEGELKLVGTHDGLGHILIAIELRSGSYELDWMVRTAVRAEAGQLEGIAKRARAFFGAQAPR